MKHLFEKGNKYRFTKKWSDDDKKELVKLIKKDKGVVDFLDKIEQMKATDPRTLFKYIWEANKEAKLSIDKADKD